MEFLVTMTTEVPDGTALDTVADTRRAEADHSRLLAEQGSLRRLWRPPLKPGEWRTLGLFAADDAIRLESILAAMPLRIWRTDDVTPLAPHPNDPDLSGVGEEREYFVATTVTIPVGTPATAVDDTMRRESQRARELADRGHLRRLWALPNDGSALGLWHAHGAYELDGILTALPLHAWMKTVITALSPHPNDPGREAPSRH